MNGTCLQGMHTISRKPVKKHVTLCYVTDNTEHSHESENPITTRHKIGGKQNTLR